MNHTGSTRIHTRVQDICLMISQDQLIRIQVQKLQKVWSWAQIESGLEYYNTAES